MNNVYVHFFKAQPHSTQLLGVKNDLFSPSPRFSLGRKCHFCPCQADVNSVVLRQDRFKRSIHISKMKWELHNVDFFPKKKHKK